MNFLILLLFFASVVFSECASILYVIPFTSKSHYIMLRPIGLELARRGHNVTVLTAFKEIDHAPSYHQVMADNKPIWDASEGGRPNIFTMVDMSDEQFYAKILWGGGLATTEVALKSKPIQEFLQQHHSFDLVISSMFFQEATYMLAHKYNAPLALVSTFGNCMRNNIMMRNPLQLATVMNEFIAVKEPNSFLGRLRNFYFAAYEYFWFKFWYVRKQEQLAKKYIKNLPEPVPSLEELQRDTSLFLMNIHFSFDTPAAYLPNLVEVGGLHLNQEFDTLPKDLENILEKATKGVIYMSFGSHVRSSELPLKKKKTFLNVFRRLEYLVLWKWEEESLDGQPDNLIIRKWFPQKEILVRRHDIVTIELGSHFHIYVFGGIYCFTWNSDAPDIGTTAYTEVNGWGQADTSKQIGKVDRLRENEPMVPAGTHPNVKAFISHGGLIGTQEAVFHGVPIIGVPIYADQYNNVLQAQEAGMGKVLQYHDINEENLESALRTVLEDDTYRIRAKEMSVRFQDRPSTALNTAMFWIEYVIRHKGADFMKNPARKLGWVEYYLLDVFAFFLVTVAVFLFVLVKLIKYWITKKNVDKAKSKRS